MGRDTSIAVDASSTVWVSYLEAIGYEENAIKVAHKPAGGDWVIETIARGWVLHPSIAVDASGTVWVSYVDPAVRSGNGFAIKVARRPADGSWSHEVVDDRTGAYGTWGQVRNTSIAVDASGTVWVLYGAEDAVGVEVQFFVAYKPAGGGWSVDVAPSTDDLGEPGSIVVDASGAAWYSFSDATPTVPYTWVGVARKPAGGDWSRDSIEGGERVGVGTSLAVDGATGTIWVGYYYDDGWRDRDLVVAHKPDGGDWVIETVDDTGDSVGTDSSIAIDSGGTVWVGYSDETNGDAKVARKPASGDWIIETVDAVGNVGRDVSIAVDNSTGAVWISYRDVTSDDLKVAVLDTSCSL